MKNLLLVLGTALMMAVLPVSMAVAAPATDICSGTAKTSAYCNKDKTSTDPIAGPNGILINVANLIAIIAGIVLVIMLIVAGIRYITSSGDSNGIQKAKDTIMHALIGLIVIVFARTLIAYLVSRI